MREPFTFRLVAICPDAHESEILSARIDPADLSTLGAAESRIPAAGVPAKCVVCGLACATVRQIVDGQIVEEVSIEEFNRRAVGKAPPQNYG